MASRSAVLILPFKGRIEVGHVIVHRTDFFLSFKGRTEVGMGLSALIKETHPHPILLLEGE